MKRFLSTALALTLLLSLGALAVLARGGGDILSPADNVVASAALAAVPARFASAVAASVAQADTIAPTEPNAVAMVTGRYHSFAMPLDAGITKASGMKTYIESSTGATVTKLLKWDAAGGTSGAWITYQPGYFSSQDFDLLVGDAFFALVIAATPTPPATPTPLSFVGDVPAEHSITRTLLGDAGACRYNFISLPLDKSGLAKAADLYADIGDVKKILAWDAASGTMGSWLTYQPGYFSSTNFDVRIGYPYFVCMLASKPWPVW